MTGCKRISSVANCEWPDPMVTMNYLYHIRHCNSHDLTDLVIWHIEGRKAGLVGPQLASRLRDFPDVFIRDSCALELNKRLSTVRDRTSAVSDLLDRLREDSFIGPLRNEPYAVAHRPGGEALMIIDRSAATAFGVISTGFHLNGTIGAGTDLAMWIARRAMSKMTFPGQLDNMVAGGQPATITLAENVRKECHEEASIPEALARQAVPVSLVSYIMKSNDGLRRHVMYIYDLDLPPEFVPRPFDGEVDSFALTPIRQVAETVRNRPDAFKFNCNLVIIDFLIRHGMIGPDHPDYFDLVAGLRRTLS